MSLEAGPDILVSPFQVQRVTRPNWSEVGEEGHIGMGAGGGIWAAVPGCLHEHRWRALFHVGAWMDVCACASNGGFQVSSPMCLNSPVPVVHPFLLSEWRWQVLGSVFLENKLHPAGVLELPLHAYTSRSRGCAPGWSRLELILWWGWWLTNSWQWRN